MGWHVRRMNSSTISPDRLEHLRHLEAHLAEQIRGQDHVLPRVASVQVRDQLGHYEKKKHEAEERGPGSERMAVLFSVGATLVTAVAGVACLVRMAGQAPRRNESRSAAGATGLCHDCVTVAGLAFRFAGVDQRVEAPRGGDGTGSADGEFRVISSRHEVGADVTRGKAGGPVEKWRRSRFQERLRLRMAVSRILFLRSFPRIRRSFLSRRSRGASHLRGMRLLPGGCPAFAEPARCQPPVLSCTARGFSCPGACAPGGGLLPRLFTLAPRTFRHTRRFVFCDTFLRAGLSPGAPAYSTRRAAWWCSDFPLHWPKPVQRSSAIRRES